MPNLTALLLGACGGGASPTATLESDRERRSLPATEETFGPLEVGADTSSFTKLTSRPFLSAVHGNRWVDVYVNAVGAAAYTSSDEIPVGTIVVKTSWLDDGGAPSQTAGPTFVMEKRAPGYAPEHGDWWYAIHWATPPAAEAKKFGGPIYWRGRARRVQYCWDCHDSYDRSLGGLIPSSILQR